MAKAGEIGGEIALSNNIFRSSCPGSQYISQQEREKFIRDYNRARDNYLRAVAESRRAYDELVKRGWMPARDGKSEQ